MAKFDLQHNEVVILRAEGVAHGSGMLSNHTDELVLTNLHLIWVNKGMLGNVKRTEHYPLSLIKVRDGRVQALASQDRGGLHQLEVYLQTSVEAFRFPSGGKKLAEKWSAAVDQAVTGNETTPRSSGRALPGAALVADTLRGTFDQFRTSFGGAPAAPVAAPAPSRSAAPCPSCGAPISGISGSTAKCEYCDMETRLP